MRNDLVEERRTRWLLVALSVLLVGSVGLGCGDDSENGNDSGEPNQSQNQNGDNSGDPNGNGECGDTYEPFEGVWLSEEFDRDNFNQYIERDVDGPEAINSIYDADNDDLLSQVLYCYEVGDEVDVSFGGDTVEAKEIDIEILEVLEGEPQGPFEEGTQLYDILYITDDGDSAYFGPDATTDADDRPDSLVDIEYVRQ